MYRFTFAKVWPQLYSLADPRFGEALTSQAADLFRGGLSVREVAGIHLQLHFTLDLNKAHRLDNQPFGIAEITRVTKAYPKPRGLTE